MELLGRVDEEGYQKLLEILKSALPNIQPENAPYIVLKVLSKYQVMALQGIYKKQGYEIYLMEIRLPNIDPKKLIPVNQTTYDELKQYINKHVPFL